MIRRLSMLLSLGLFTVLLVVGKLQFWLFILLGSVLLALLFGRFFCGWICPINTFIEIGMWVKSKLGIRDKTPKALQHRIWGVGLLALLVAGLVLTRVTGKNIPFLLLMIPLGVVIALSFSPASWHHWLCPYNVLFRITGGKSLFSLSVAREKCIGCSKCHQVCPASAIEMKESKARIDKSACLLCTSCQIVCPTKAIGYSSSQQPSREKQAG